MHSQLKNTIKQIIMFKVRKGLVWLRCQLEMLWSNIASIIKISFFLIESRSAGVGNLLLVTGQMSNVQIFGGPEFSLTL